MTVPTNKRAKKYFRVEQDRYIFEKRLNSDHGWFPLFEKKLIRVMRVGSKSEAEHVARQYVEELKHLQLVASRDNHMTFTSTPSEIARAVRTWLWATKSDQLLNRVGASDSLSQQGIDVRAELDDVLFAVTEAYRSEGGFGKSLTPFGAALYRALTEDVVPLTFSQAVQVYYRCINKADMEEKDPRQFKRNQAIVGRFIDSAGDLSIERYQAEAVREYIDSELRRGLKTTSVDRQLNLLAAIWVQAAREQRIAIPNPFGSRRIKDKGLDKSERKTAGLMQTQEVLKLIDAEDDGASYKFPLLKLYILTGAQNAEIFHLQQEDINSDEQALYIREDPKAGRRLKTKYRTRRWPIEPELMDALDQFFCRKRPSKVDSAGANIIKWLKTRGYDLTPYSFRHGMKDRLLEVNIDFMSMNDLLGWTQGKHTSNNYGGYESLEKKRKFIRAVYDQLFHSN